MAIAAVERALKLIEALAGEPGGVDLSLLAERLDLPFQRDPSPASHAHGARFRAAGCTSPTPMA